MIRKMLTLDQKLRWSAKQLLSHPWITAGDDVLKAYDLSGSIVELKRYNARRRLRAAADAVIMANRIRKLTGCSPMEINTETVDQSVTSDYKPPSKSVKLDL